MVVLTLSSWIYHQKHVIVYHLHWDTKVMTESMTGKKLCLDFSSGPTQTLLLLLGQLSVLQQQKLDILAYGNGKYEIVVCMVHAYDTA